MKHSTPRTRTVALGRCGLLLLSLLAVAAAAAEAPTHDHNGAVDKPMQEIGCIPKGERGARKLGCFITETEVLGKLPDTQLYWHLFTYPTLAAAKAARGKQGSIVQSYGKVWLFTVADADWTANAGQRVARVGPLPVSGSGSYTAVFMEATFMPGMSSRVHRHPGPEAWYVIAGEQCLETPGHKQVVRAGETGIVPQGPPMMLSGIGTSERRALVLILHDSSQPATIPAPDWKPAGLCTGASERAAAP
jgi:quercetin dioxygenase-like cupin family protein